MLPACEAIFQLSKRRSVFTSAYIKEMHMSRLNTETNADAATRSIETDSSLASFGECDGK